jgi:hypothetical protein
MKNYRLSLFGLIGATFFLGMFVGAYLFNMNSISSNVANSGEGGIILILYAMPWVMIFPKSFLGFALGLILNTILIYLVLGGGFALVRRERPQQGTPVDAKTRRE